MPAITCPHCRKSINAPAEAAGRKIACPHCRRAIGLAAPPVSPPRWFYARNRQKVGPIGWKDLKALVAQGELKATDMVLPEGQTTWQLAQHVPGLFAAIDGPIAVAPVAVRPRKAPAPTRKRRTALWATGTGVAIVLLLLGVLRFFRGSPPPEAQQDVADIVPTKKWAPEEKFVAEPLPAAKVEPKQGIPEPKPRIARTEAYDLRAVSGLDYAGMIVARLNLRRKLAGVGAVTLDRDLSQGCQAHAEYVARNRDHPKLAGAGIQDEDPALPGFRDEGKQAARTSLLVIAEPGKALDLWFGRLLSRLPLLDPELLRVGFGTAQNVNGDWVCALDPVRGRGPEPIAYPPPKQSDVPLNFSGGPELDDSAGHPVSLLFPIGTSLSDVSAALTDTNGNRVPTWVSTPSDPLPGVRHPSVVGLIPKQPLQSSSKYRARFTLKASGRSLEKLWEFTTEDGLDTSNVWAEKVLARLNEVRTRAGLEPVTLDPDLSVGCRNHARYLALNARHPSTQGLGGHQEDPKLPGFTPEGQDSGKKSNIALGDYEPLDAVDGWLATLYHRVPMLEPQLRRIGFGCARGDRLGWITVLHLFAEKAPRPGPVFYPADGQVDVPLNFPPGGETPDPIPEDKTGRAGYPITAFFPRERPVTKAQGKLENAQGKVVPCWFSSPDQLANPQFPQGTTICLIPKTPLEPKQRYRVTMSASIAGVAWEKAWTFETGTAGMSPAEASERVLARLNQVRRQAGLKTVELDADASKGCQAHAEYLLRNPPERGNADFSVNEEKATQPGYTPEGARAARRSDVFFQAPRPEIQVEELMATLSRRLSVLEPRLSRIGLGCAHDVGRGWINVLDLNPGREEITPTIFPAEGQDQVPAQGGDRLPNEPGSIAGFPITVQFPPSQRVRQVRGTLTDVTGNTIDIWLSSPEQPLVAGAIVNAIAIHPRRPLRPGQVYSVNVQAEVEGRDWRRRWRFSTASE